MIVTVKLKGAQDTLLALERVRLALVGGDVQRLGRSITREAIRVVKKLTPVQKKAKGIYGRPFPSFRSQWDYVEDSVSESVYVSQIRNRATLTNPGLIALASVEFGARPHRIPSSGLRLMAWDSPAVVDLFKFRASSQVPGIGGRDVTDLHKRRRQSAETVYTQAVNHPGTHGFRMVEETKKHIGNMADVLLRNFARQIAAEFNRLSVRVE